MNLWKYFKQTLSIFVSSFIVGPSFVYSALADALYWFLTFLTAVVAKNFIIAAMYRLGPANLTPAILMDPAVAAQTLSTMRWFFISIAFVLFALFLVELIVYSACKGFVWLVLLGRKPSWQFFKGFFKLNLTWWLLWIVPVIVLFFGLKPEFFPYVAVVILVLYLHLTGLLHIAYTKTLSIRKAFAEAFGTGIRLHYYILPYTLAFAVYWLAVQLFRFLPQEQRTMLVAAIIFVIFFLAWFRGFLLRLITKIYT